MSEVLELGKRRAESLGIKPDSCGWYSPEDIHQLLGAGVETFGHWVSPTESSCWVSPVKQHGNSHQALMIGIKPIVQESPERQLLRELVEREKFSFSANPRYKLNDWLTRAKALLESEVEK